MYIPFQFHLLFTHSDTPRIIQKRFSKIYSLGPQGLGPLALLSVSRFLTLISFSILISFLSVSSQFHLSFISFCTFHYNSISDYSTLTLRSLYAHSTSSALAGLARLHLPLISFLTFILFHLSFIYF
jgi:hypothetical protein